MVIALANKKEITKFKLKRLKSNQKEYKVKGQTHFLVNANQKQIGQLKEYSGRRKGIAREIIINGKKTKVRAFPPGEDDDVYKVFGLDFDDKDDKGRNRKPGGGEIMDGESEFEVL